MTQHAKAAAIAALLLVAVIGSPVLTLAQVSTGGSETDDRDSTAQALLESSDEPTFDVESFIDEVEAAAHTSRLKIRSRIAVDPQAWDERGYSEGSYLGGPDAMQTRAEATALGIAGGIAIQKDAWEKRYTDDWAGYLETVVPIGTPDARLSSVIAGSYRLSFGSGLIFGSGLTSVALRTSPGRNPSSPFGLRHSLSPHAQSPLFGVSASADLHSFSVTPFYSRTKLDARLDTNGIRTLYSYYHRTTTEEQYRGTSSLTIAGMHLALHDSSIGDVGATYARNSYGDPLHTASSKIPQGSRLSMIGIDANVPLRDVAEFSGEYAASTAEASTGRAYIFSVSTSPFEACKLFAAYHHQDTAYFAPFGSIVGESEGDLTNSEGYWLGAEASLSNSLRGSAGLEYSRNVNQLSRAIGAYKFDGFVDLAWELLPSMLTEIRYRNRQSTGSSAFGVDDKVQHNIRVLARWSATDNFAVDVKSELTEVNHSAGAPAASGLMLQMTAALNWDAGALRATLVRFSSDNYDARLYSYVPQVAGIGSILLLNGDGFYTGLSGRIALSHWLSLEGFGGAYLYDNSKTIGSGLTERSSSTDITTMLQLTIRP